MNYKNLIPVIFILFLTASALTLHGQTVRFGYDDNGNRTSRSLMVEELQSGSATFPVDDPESLDLKYSGSDSKGSGDQKKGEAEEVEKMVSEDSEIRAKVYPNPTKGFLRIEISNMPSSSRNEMRLYDLKGNELLIMKDFGSNEEMDLSGLSDGIYILKIRINENLFDWKVIKNH